MFDLANYFASVNSRKAAMTNIKSPPSSSSDEDTASTTSVSSDSTPGSNSGSRLGRYNSRQAKQQHKQKVVDRRSRNFVPPSSSNESSSDEEEEDQEEAVVNYPPKIAFQIFQLMELKRRCTGLYRRHQEYRRDHVIKANRQVITDFESYEIDGEMFV